MKLTPVSYKKIQVNTSSAAPPSYLTLKVYYTYLGTVASILRDFLNEDVVEKLIRHEA